MRFPQVLTPALIGEGSLRRAVSEFVLHSRAEKNHQGLGNKIIRPELAEFPVSAKSNAANVLAGCFDTTTRKPLNRVTPVFGQTGSAVEFVLVVGDSYGAGATR